MTDIYEHANTTIAGDNIQIAVPEERTFECGLFNAEYGVRTDDSAMVFHFFPAGEEWDHERLRTGLSEAIKTCFDPENVQAEYVPELESYCVLVGGMGLMPDPWTYAEIFLKRIET